MKDYYKILEIENDASDEEIKRAYRKLALKYHPDKIGGADDKFKEIGEAYETLSDSNKKNAYDKGDQPNINMSGGMSNEIFEQLFRNGFNFNQFTHQQQKRGNSLQQIKVKLNDIHTGIDKKLKVNIKRTCFDCRKVCNICNGSGVIMIQNGPFMTQNHCSKCKTIGSIYNFNNNCKNKCINGHISVDEICSIHIPKCAQNGHNIIVDNLGEQAQKEGELPGNLIFQIIIDNDPYFKRENNDLIYKVPLTFKESIIGKDIKIPHFDGIILENTAGFGVINPKKRYSFSKQGLGNMGDLVLEFDIMYPELKYNNEIINEFQRINF
jgi:DnaJ family protein A protein 2